MVEARVTGADDLRKLAARLAKADLVPEFERELRRVGGPIVGDVRAHIAGIPSSGRKHTGLRAALIRATEQLVTASKQQVRLRIQTNPGRMPPGQRAMPAAMEGQAFIHPVYGNPWQARQQGHPYLRGTVVRHLPQARAAVVRAADSMTAKLTRR
jgi:hypothetical protein